MSLVFEGILLCTHLITTSVFEIKYISKVKLLFKRNIAVKNDWQIKERMVQRSVLILKYP